MVPLTGEGRGSGRPEPARAGGAHRSATGGGHGRHGPSGMSAARILGWAAALAALAGVFALYLQPTMLVALSELVWACFN